MAIKVINLFGEKTKENSDNGSNRWSYEDANLLRDAINDMKENLKQVLGANGIGPKGDTGPDGDQGPQGAQGPVGDRGPTGPKGVNATRVPDVPGPAGDNGAVGPPGNSVTGPQGLRGQNGYNGKSFQHNSLLIDRFVVVSTLENNISTDAANIDSGANIVAQVLHPQNRTFHLMFIKNPGNDNNYFETGSIPNIYSGNRFVSTGKQVHMTIFSNKPRPPHGTINLRNHFTLESAIFNSNAIEGIEGIDFNLYV